MDFRRPRASAPKEGAGSWVRIERRALEGLEEQHRENACSVGEDDMAEGECATWGPSRRIWRLNRDGELCISAHVHYLGERRRRRWREKQRRRKLVAAAGDEDEDEDEEKKRVATQARRQRVPARPSLVTCSRLCATHGLQQRLGKICDRILIVAIGSSTIDFHHLRERVQDEKAMGDDPRRRTPQGVLKAPQYVRFHPRDDGSFCDEIFWER